MDERLVAWARAVKARRRSRLPTLWLFTDERRSPDLLGTITALPRGLCGVVFRHDGVSDRAALLRTVARLCRARRLALVATGPTRGPAWAGRHLRGGFGRADRLTTSSAHAVADLIRARRAGAHAAFLSPVFPTRTHPGVRTLGPWRWGRMARRAGLPVLALGGIDGRSVRRLPRWAAGAGAIDALL